MTSVQDTLDCPQCGALAYVEFQTRTLAESIFCPRCGYTEHARPLIDRKHGDVFKCRKDGEPIVRTTKHAGHGAYLIAQANGVSAMGVLNHKLTPRMIADFKRDLTQPGIDQSRSYLTRWNTQQRRVKTVIGTAQAIPIL